jgi:chemotaxis protein CheD
LGQGEVFLAKKPAAVKTVLGSCVAVIFHIPRLKISSLCHALLPEPHGDGRCRETCPRRCSRLQSEFGDLKYVTCCIRKMLEGLHQFEVRRKEVITTLVGGANVLTTLDQRWSVADRNIAVAIATLERHRLPIQYMDVGGNEGRTIEHLSDVNRTTVRFHRSDLPVGGPRRT